MEKKGDGGGGLKPVEKGRSELRADVAGIILLAAAALGWAGLYVQEAGAFGAFLQRVLTTLFGSVATAVPGLAAVAGISLLCRKEMAQPVRAAGAVLALALLAAGWHLPIPAADAFLVATQGGGGGVLGFALAWLLRTAFGVYGAWIMLMALSAVALVMITGLSVRAGVSALGKWLRRGVVTVWEGLRDFLFSGPAEAEQKAVPVRPTRDTKEEKNPRVRIVDQVAALAEEDFQTDGHQDAIEKPLPEKKTTPKQITLGSEVTYQMPPFSLLQKIVRLQSLKRNRDVVEKAKLLETTLHNFGVEGRVVEVTRGPTITRFEWQPAPGVKVSRIVSLADDIALSLAAPDVRIEAPIPGKAAVGIEVPNEEIAVVYLREVLESEEFGQATSPLTVGLGKDIGGKPIISSLDKMLHLLIAGATGSGKSVCLNTIIASIMFKARPEQVKFLMIDPKVVELNTYNGIPHLLAPVVTDPRKAAGCLRWAVKEMEDRYERFAAAGARDITSYNAYLKKKAQIGAGPDEFLPYLVVVIDELADLMMVAAVEVEDAIARLAQMARAAGIHLVVATQRPSVDVITGLIKANIPSRIAFAVSSQVDSRTILDMGGAEKLLGKGDMLFYPVTATKPLRAQGAFISEREVRELVDFVCRQGAPEYDAGVLQVECAVSVAKEEQEDELFDEAIRVVLEAGQASASLLQRRLRVGYARGARLLDAMEKHGYVGRADGSKPREVLITREQYERLNK